MDDRDERRGRVREIRHDDDIIYIYIYILCVCVYYLYALVHSHVVVQVN